MSDCEKYQELISRKLDEALSPEEEAALADHLRACPDCAAMAEAFAALSRSLSAELEEAPEELCVNIMARLHREDIQKNNRRSGRRGFRLILSAAACAALLLVGGYSLRPVLTQDNAAAIPAKAQLAGGAAMDLALPEAAPAEAPAAMAVPEEAYSESAVETQSNTAADQMPAAEAGFDSGAVFSAMMRLPRGVNRPPLPWEELDALLAGTQVQEDFVLPEEPVLVLTVSLEGVNQDVAFYEQEGGLFYSDPADRQLKESSCTVEQLQDFSGS